MIMMKLTVCLIACLASLATVYGSYVWNPSCIRSCSGVGNGDYASCLGCNVYATCSNALMYDNRPCPAGLVWDDGKKRCEYTSATCEIRTRTTTTTTTTSAPTTTTPRVIRRSRVACERNGVETAAKDMRIDCSRVSRTIRVTSANYGRTQPLDKRCPSKHSPNQDTQCRYDVAAKAGALCNGRAVCTLEPTNHFWGRDPCFGTYKYLLVRYDCV